MKPINPTTFFILEHMSHIYCMPLRILKLCGLKFITINDKGDSFHSMIWVCFRLDLHLAMMSSTAQQIIVEVNVDNKLCRLTRVYAST